MALEIRNLHAGVEGHPIVRGLSLTVPKGQLHVIMGPNGSGKSTLAATLMGHPSYTITQGTIKIDGTLINTKTPEQRAQKGLFLCFQYPAELPGVGIAPFLRSSYNALHQQKKLSIPAFRRYLKTELVQMGMRDDVLERGVNEGFSGGEKKRAEILQMRILKPRYAILDECDSGLDIDALRLVANAIEQTRSKNLGILLITHYQRILNYLKPDKVHVMMHGTIVASGDHKLAQLLEKKGYRAVAQLKPTVH